MHKHETVTILGSVKIRSPEPLFAHEFCSFSANRMMIEVKFKIPKPGGPLSSPFRFCSYLISGIGSQVIIAVSKE